jgi:hypothetical protein
MTSAEAVAGSLAREPRRPAARPAPPTTRRRFPDHRCGSGSPAPSSLRRSSPAPPPGCCSFRRRASGADGHAGPGRQGIDRRPSPARRPFLCDWATGPSSWRPARRRRSRHRPRHGRAQRPLGASPQPVRWLPQWLHDGHRRRRREGHGRRRAAPPGPCTTTARATSSATPSAPARTLPPLNRPQRGIDARRTPANPLADVGLFAAQPIVVDGVPVGAVVVLRIFNDA